MIGPKVTPPTKAESRAAYEAVKERSGGICEGCQINLASEVHHRVYRSRGGLDTVSNLLHLCGGLAGVLGGNHSGCHGDAHTLIGEQRGWSVRSRLDPAIVPVFHLFDGTWTRNHEGAEPELLNPIDAVEYMMLVGAIKSGVSV